MPLIQYIQNRYYLSYYTYFFQVLQEQTPPFQFGHLTWFSGQVDVFYHEIISRASFSMIFYIFYCKVVYSSFWSRQTNSQKLIFYNIQDCQNNRSGMENLGIYGFKSMKNGKWICADNYGNGPIIANRTDAKDWEKFVLVNKYGSRAPCIKSIVSGKYISSSNNELVLSDRPQAWVVEYEKNVVHTDEYPRTCPLLYWSIENDNIVRLSPYNKQWEQIHIVKFG